MFPLIVIGFMFYFCNIKQQEAPNSNWFILELIQLGPISFTNEILTPNFIKYLLIFFCELNLGLHFISNDTKIYKYLTKEFEIVI